VRDRTVPLGKPDRAVPPTAPAPRAGGPVRHILALQRAAGNAATAHALAGWRGGQPPPTVQRDTLIDSAQVLPQPVVAPDGSRTDRLAVRYGREVVATITVTGPGAVASGIQVRDRTGARNRGARTEAVDLDIVHPPGWVVTVEPARAALTRTKKALGVGAVTVTQVVRRPPYGRDVETELWPAPHGPGTALHQRRDLTKKEAAAERHDRDDRRQRAAERQRELAELEKEYGRLTRATDIADKYLMDLHGVGVIFQMMADLPTPDLYNNIRKDLALAAYELDAGSPGTARTVLKRADAALWAANGRVNATVRHGNANLDTAIRAVAKIDAITLFIGEEIARRIPGPIGVALMLIYEAAKPPPQTMDELAWRLQGAAQTGQQLGSTPLPTTPGEAPTRPATRSTEPEPVAPGGAGGGTTSPTPGPTRPGTPGSGSTPSGTTEPVTGTAAPGRPLSGTTHDQTPPPAPGPRTTRTQTPDSRQTPDTADEHPPQAGAANQRRAPAPQVAGSSDKFVANRAARVAQQTHPTLESFDGFTFVLQIGGRGRPPQEGINPKYILADAQGKHWMFKPAAAEEHMRYGPRIGILQGERYRRAAAAAYVADELGIDTPGVRLGEWNGQLGSLQEWRTGFTDAPRSPRFDEFRDSQQLKDLDALDYVTAQQDRHLGNVQLRDQGQAGFDMLAVDQDASFPTSAQRYDPAYDRNSMSHQRPIPPTVSKGMADRLRQLYDNWPEAVLRQWLTKAEVDGAYARLTEVITALDTGNLRVAP
jgi:hypothetical protein